MLLIAELAAVPTRATCTLGWGGREQLALVCVPSGRCVLCCGCGVEEEQTTRHCSCHLTCLKLDHKQSNTSSLLDEERHFHGYYFELFPQNFIVNYLFVIQKTICQKSYYNVMYIIIIPDGCCFLFWAF